jgi:hypothetical protein
MPPPEWHKLGRIFAPSGCDFMISHAQNPLPEAIGDGIYRVHFASRDRANRARGGYFEFDIRHPLRTFNVSAVPTLDLGELGAFDDSGVMPSGLITIDGARRMYYTGWSKMVDVPFAFHIGLAVSSDGGATYARFSRAPVLGRNKYDPFITGAPYVLFDQGIFKMWYISATKWELPAGSSKPRHYYTVKYAHSSDGIHWTTSDHLCIAYAQDEYAIARPVVFRDGEKYRMWFTFRGGHNTYRIGTAESNDGVEWTRDPEPLGLDVSMDGWDSNMICYAHPIVHGQRMYALYNGNNYGETGVGLAVLQ